MIAVFPGSGCGLECFDLAQARELSFGGLRQETTALAASDQLVDILDQLLGKHDMGTFGDYSLATWRPISMLTAM
jgi:hypothetical protein